MYWGELGVSWRVLKGKLGGGRYNGEELPEEGELFPVLTRGREVAL